MGENVQKTLGNQPNIGENESSRSGAETPKTALTTRAAKDSDDMADSDSTSGRAPAFQFYPNDFLSDRNVIVMSMQERGVYITLICHAWQKPLTSDVTQLARICGMSLSSFRKIWPAISICFREQDGLLVHPRLERERLKQNEYRQKQAERGRASGAARRGKPTEPETNTGSSLVEPESNGGSGAGSTSVEPRAVELLSKTPPPSQSLSRTHLVSSGSQTPHGVVAADGRSKHPVFKGQRLVVFDWMSDDLARLLGKPATDALDFHEWFYELDARVAESGEVVPQRDGGKWLQAQTLAEAERRGLITKPEHKSKLTQALEKASDGW